MLGILIGVLAAVFTFRGQTAEANSALREDLAERSALLWSASELEGQFRYQEAVTKLVRALQLNHKDYLVNLRLGWLFYAMGQFANAQRHYEQAQTSEPRALPPRLGLMNIAMKVSNWRQAAEIGTALLQIQPSDYHGNIKMVHTLRSLGEYQRALDIVESYLTIYPGSWAFLQFKSILLDKLKRPLEAARVMQQMLMLGTNQAQQGPIVP